MDNYPDKRMNFLCHLMNHTSHNAVVRYGDSFYFKI